ncbi:MAG: T9SS type A sorting domain-containing protein, partial [Candidatus Kapaibacterium sp.]
TPTDRYIQDNGRAYMTETIPSPIQGFGKIEYRVIESTNVSISIFDILGNKIEVLVNKYHEAGEYSVEINPQILSAGNYLYKLETPSMEIIKKMTIIR